MIDDTGPGALRRAMRTTLVDMIKNRTYCGCCDSDTNHARLVVEMLRRFPVEVWLDYMGRDKKNEGGHITLILLDALGRAAIVKDAPERELEEFLAGV